MPSSACQTCALDRKSTRLNSSHTLISYAVFCLKKKIRRRADSRPGGALHPSRQPLDARRRRLTNLESFFFNDTATTEIYTLSLHDALPISRGQSLEKYRKWARWGCHDFRARSEEHTSELQSHSHLVCRLLLEKKKQPVDINEYSKIDSFLRFEQQYGLPHSGLPACHLSTIFAIFFFSIFRSFFFFFLNKRAPPNFSPFPLPAPLPI